MFEWMTTMAAHRGVLAELDGRVDRPVVEFVLAARQAPSRRARVSEREDEHAEKHRHSRRLQQKGKHSSGELHSFPASRSCHTGHTGHTGHARHALYAHYARLVMGARRTSSKKASTRSRCPSRSDISVVSSNPRM